MVWVILGGTVNIQFVWTILYKKKKTVKNKMVRVAADLLEVDMFDGIMELIQKEKRLNLVAK